MDDAAPLRTPDMARGAQGRRRGPGVSDPRRDARGSRPAPAARHRHADRLEICRRAASAIPDDVVLLPPIIHGYTPHHMDFPGPITIGWETFVKYAVDIGTSLARHGFKRILYLNGHGSNIPLIDMAARLVGLEHSDVLAAAAFYLTSDEGDAGGRGRPRVGPRRHGTRVRAGDQHLPGHRSRRRVHGQGGGRELVPRRASTRTWTGPTGRSRSCLRASRTRGPHRGSRQAMWKCSGTRGG